MQERKLWVGSIVIDCHDFPRMMAFWQEALHYAPKYPAEKGWVILKDPGGKGPNVSLSQSSEGPLDDYRLHLDLYSTDPEGEVRRLVGLGAALKRPRAPGEDFATLADPDGNLFDVIWKEGLQFGEH
ncbi:MAG TPA: VOC family protein [Nitrososphaerales archaeon]|nr:VOC family protein [Nitrososphaerales archaeon]